MQLFCAKVKNCKWRPPAAVSSRIALGRFSREGDSASYAILLIRSVLSLATRYAILAMTVAAAAMVSSISSSVWAWEMKPASKAEGAR